MTSESDSDIGADCNEFGEAGVDELRCRVSAVLKISSDEDTLKETYASPSSSESSFRLLLGLVVLPFTLAVPFDAMLDLGAEVSLSLVVESPADGDGEAVLAVTLVGLDVSSPEESSPASARSSASRSAILALGVTSDRFQFCYVVTSPEACFVSSIVCRYMIISNMCKALAVIQNVVVDVNDVLEIRVFKGQRLVSSSYFKAKRMECWSIAGVLL